METMVILFQQCLLKLFPYPFSLIPFILFAIILYKSRAFSSSTTTSKNLPPSPPKLPVIGNLHQLSPALHRSLLSLSRKYGHLMLLHLGYKPTVVISSVEAAREIMKTHDLIFSNRPKSRVARSFFYDCKDMAFAPYGQHWKQMKNICMLQLLSNKKVQAYGKIREEEVDLIVEKINKSQSLVMNLSEILMTFTNDVICRAAFGMKCSDNNESEGVKFKELLFEAVELLQDFCLGDFIPWLSWVDRVRGLTGRVERVAKEIDEFLEKVVREHQHRLSTKENIIDAESDEGKNNVKNFVEYLVKYQMENKHAFPSDGIKTVTYIKALTLDMIAAGTEPIYALLEWTMCELIRHPRVMNELQKEVRKIPGQRVCEDDLEKLIYLKAVIKESLRLHPPAPLLLFREPSEDVKVCGFDITAGTQVIINAWAIHRDDKYWDDPLEFLPERFTESTTSIDFRGPDVQYIPFGGGRRICPGISFTIANAELVLANLIHEFDWNSAGGEECGGLDVDESVGFTVHKEVPLMVIATPRCS